jgi:hypothetical protein
MPVIPHECHAEEVRSSAVNSRGNKDTLSRDARAHLGLPYLACDMLALTGVPPCGALAQIRFLPECDSPVRLSQDLVVAAAVSAWRQLKLQSIWLSRARQRGVAATNG